MLMLEKYKRRQIDKNYKKQQLYKNPQASNFNETIISSFTNLTTIQIINANVKKLKK